MRLIVLSLTLGAACSFELTPVPAQPDQATVALLDAGRTDAPARDAPPRDAPVLPDGLNPDRRKPDTRAPDTRAPDTRSPDLRNPDLLKPDTKPPPPPKNCTTMYGTASSFQLCEEKGASCRFYAWTAGSTCDAFCKKFGGQCVGAENNTGTTPQTKCVPNWDWMNCFQTFDDQICECSKI